MADVLLFHHAQGLTAGMRSFADDLRAAGHTVTTPDLFGGKTFDTVVEGVTFAEEIGFETIIERGVAAADPVDGRFVAAGFSLGVMPAQKLAQTNSAVSGAIFYHGAVPLAAFGGNWPDGVPLQLFFCENDPWAVEDLPAARELVEQIGADLHVYPGDGHLVADSTSSDYDADLASRILASTIAFLNALG